MLQCIETPAAGRMSRAATYSGLDPDAPLPEGSVLEVGRGKYGSGHIDIIGYYPVGGRIPSEMDRETDEREAARYAAVLAACTQPDGTVGPHSRNNPARWPGDTNYLDNEGRHIAAPGNAGGWWIIRVADGTVTVGSKAGWRNFAS